MATVVGFDDRGREIHRLREVTPISASARMNRRTREALVDDYGVTERGISPVKPRQDLTHFLDDVPLVGGEFSYGTPQIGVEFSEGRRASQGGDVTYAALREADVPLIPPARRRGRLRSEEGTSLAGSDFAKHGGEGEDEGEADEVWAGESGEDEAELEDAETGEEENEGGEEDEVRDADLAEFVEETAKSVHAASRAMHAAAQLLRLRRQRAVTGGALGLYG